MKKIVLALMLGIIFGAQAQTAVVAPDQPTLPQIATISPNALTALGDSTTNRVFIDQSGSTPTVNATQNGTGNSLGSSADSPMAIVVPKATTGTAAWTLNSPVYLRGTNQTVTTVQNGNNNAIGLALVNPDTGAGVGATVTVQQLGDNNTADIACGYGSSSTGTALTGCKSADINWKFDGDSNHMQFRGSGDLIKSAIDVLGNNNSFFVDVVGNKHTQTISVNGNDNVFNISQTSTGSNGSSVWIEAGSTGTRYTINQTGSIDNVANIKTAGTTGGTFNITQKN
jgi:hypothetical protein